MCNTEAEDLPHFILRCDALTAIRDKYMDTISSLYTNFNTLNEDQKIRTLLDSNFITTCKLTCDTAGLEEISRSYVFSLHCKRITTLNSSWTKRREDSSNERTVPLAEGQQWEWLESWETGLHSVAVHGPHALGKLCLKSIAGDMKIRKFKNLNLWNVLYHQI